MDNTSCPNTFLDIAIRVYVSHVTVYKTTIKKIASWFFLRVRKKLILDSDSRCVPKTPYGCLAKKY